VAFNRAKEEAAAPTVERFLTLLVEGAAAGVPEVEPEAYRGFRSKVEELARRLPDRLPDEEKLALIQSILREFTSYRNGAETAALLGELLANLGVDPASADAVPLVQLAKRLSNAGEINTWREKYNLFLHPLNGKGPAEDLAARLRTADCSTANDNAAGLRGGGSALEHLRKIMAAEGGGFIVLFRMSCLEVISQRFGPEAVEDCLMAVSAYLTAGLQSSDSIYHWSDSALLAILQGRPNEAILSAELERIMAQNRESSINVAGRTIMLRIPLTFEVTPISRLRSADDLLRISAR
jgi:GGDEF domain-containing protein